MDSFLHEECDFGWTDDIVRYGYWKYRPQAFMFRTQTSFTLQYLELRIDNAFVLVGEGVETVYTAVVSLHTAMYSLAFGLWLPSTELAKTEIGIHNPQSVMYPPIWRPVTFNTIVELEANTNYMVVIRSPSSGRVTYCWYTEHAYEKGYCLTGSGVFPESTIWSLYADKYMPFKVWGSEGVDPNPVSPGILIDAKFNKIGGIVDLTPSTSLVYSDNFNSYTSNPLHGQGSWISTNNSMIVIKDISNGYVKPDTFSSQSYAYYNNSLESDQYSQIKVLSDSDQDRVGPAVRVSNFNMYGWYGNINGSILGKLVGDVWIQLATGPAFTGGSTIQLEIKNNILTGFINGSPVLYISDNSLSNGYAGICGYGNTGTLFIDEWKCGTVN